MNKTHGKHVLYKEITMFEKIENQTIINHRVAYTSTWLEGKKSSINNKSKQSTKNLFQSLCCLFRVWAEKNSLRKVSFELPVDLDFCALPRIPIPKEKNPFLCWVQLSWSLWPSRFNSFLNFFFPTIIKKNPEAQARGPPWLLIACLLTCCICECIP